MEDCIQNLLILVLIIVLIFSIIRYNKNKQIKKTIKEVNNIANVVDVNLAAITPAINDFKNNTIITYQEYTPSDVKETTIIYPIDNNIINNDLIEEDLDNNNEYVPNENVVIIEENTENKENNNFNYLKEFSNEFHGFDPDEIYPSI